MGHKSLSISTWFSFRSTGMLLLSTFVSIAVTKLECEKYSSLFISRKAIGTYLVLLNKKTLYDTFVYYLERGSCLCVCFGWHPWSQREECTPNQIKEVHFVEDLNEIRMSRPTSSSSKDQVILPTFLVASHEARNNRKGSGGRQKFIEYWLMNLIYRFNEKIGAVRGGNNTMEETIRYTGCIAVASVDCIPSLAQ